MTVPRYGGGSLLKKEKNWESIDRYIFGIAQSMQNPEPGHGRRAEWTQGEEPPTKRDSLS